MEEISTRGMIPPPSSAEQRESVRGKLQYYQELIHQNEKREREEVELNEDIEEEEIKLK